MANNTQVSDPENLRLIYNQLCTSYHSVDDFRAKLLGLLPLVSGIAIFEVLGKSEICPFLPIIGTFGAITALGLLIYELKGIQKCTGYIAFGQEIETTLFDKASSSVGHFCSLKTGHWITGFFTEPVASAFVYAAVIGAWVYVATNLAKVDEHGVIKGYAGSTGWALLATILVWVGVVAFWKFASKPVKKV